MKETEGSDRKNKTGDVV